MVWLFEHKNLCMVSAGTNKAFINTSIVLLRFCFDTFQKRALKLQQQKQKEALQREADREKEMEKERMLIAQPTTNNKVS